MPTYRFIIGQEGAVIRFNAVVRANTPEEAVDKVRQLMPPDVDFTPLDGGSFDFAEVVFNRTALSVEHIGSVEPEVVPQFEI